MPEGVGLGCVVPPPPCKLRIGWTGAVDGAGFGLRRAMARGSLSGTISPLPRHGERMGADRGFNRHGFNSAWTHFKTATHDDDHFSAMDREEQKSKSSQVNTIVPTVVMSCRRGSPSLLASFAPGKIPHNLN